MTYDADMVDNWGIAGFGRALTEAALAAGDRVVATARRPEVLDDLAELHGDGLLAVPLDVTDSRAAPEALQAGVDRFGRLDVVVNNAGYANVAPIETGEDEDFELSSKPTFGASYNVSKAAIGPLRHRVEGSSCSSRPSVAGSVDRQVSLATRRQKFAVDGFTRVLAAETAPFGIRTLVVEPSGFATDWAGSSMTIHQIPEGSGPTTRSCRHHATAGPRQPSRSCGRPCTGSRDHCAGRETESVPSHLLMGVNAVEMGLSYHVDNSNKQKRGNR